MVRNFSKRSILSISCLFLLTMATSEIFAQFNAPESVIWDEEDERYIVSNMGNGRLLEMDEEGDAETWITAGLSRPRGLTILDGIIYVTDLTYIRGYRLDIRTQVMNLLVEGAVALNDIANDGTYLYSSDSNQHKIFKIDIEDESSEEYVTEGLSVPNGLLYDEDNNRLLICSFRVNSPIQAINLDNGNLTTVVNTTLDNLDGLAVDGTGKVYVSSWSTGRVYRWEEFRDDPEEVSSGHSGPADIYINIESNFLVVPNYNANSISFVDLTLYSEITLSDSSHDFGGVPIAETVVWGMAIENTGDADLEILTANVNTPFSFVEEFEQITIPPNQTDTLIIQFSPDSIIIYVDTLSLTTNDPDRIDVGIPLQGYGQPDWQIILPDSVFYVGESVPGVTSIGTMYIQNAGIVDLIIYNAEIYDTNFVFGLTEEFDSLTISGNGRDSILIYFSPPDLNHFSDTLFITSNDPNHCETFVLLSGDGVEVKVEQLLNPILPEGFQISEIYPNPFNSIGIIDVKLPYAAPVNIEVFNSLGQIVDLLSFQELDSGKHSLTIFGEDYSSGTYFLKVKIDNKLVQVRKAILIR